MKRPVIFTRSPLCFYIFVLSSTFLLSACNTHIQQLKKAQSKFEKIEAENISNEHITDSNVNESGYRQVYDLTKGALRNEGVLEDKGLLLRAYLIRAICEWQLKEYDLAEQSAAQARAQLRQSPDALPKDRIMIEGLPSFIAVNSVHALLSARRESHASVLDTNAWSFFTEYIYDPVPNKNGMIEAAYHNLIGLYSVALAEDSDLPSRILIHCEASLGVWKNGVSYLFEQDGSGEHQDFVNAQLQWLDDEQRKLENMQD